MKSERFVWNRERWQQYDFEIITSQLKLVNFGR